AQVVVRDREGARLGPDALPLLLDRLRLVPLHVSSQRQKSLSRREARGTSSRLPPRLGPLRYLSSSVISSENSSPPDPVRTGGTDGGLHGCEPARARERERRLWLRGGQDAVPAGPRAARLRAERRQPAASRAGIPRADDAPTPDAGGGVRRRL